MKQYILMIRPAENTAICPLCTCSIDNILTCYHVDLKLLPCGFPVSCLDFQRLSVMTAHRSEHRNSAHWRKRCPVNWLLYGVTVNRLDTIWPLILELNMVFKYFYLVYYVLICIRCVGPPPELVRQREAKWINIIGQWDRILSKNNSKVRPILDTFHEKRKG